MRKLKITKEYQYVYDIVTGDCVYTCRITDGKMYFYKFDEPNKAIFFMDIK